MKIFVALPAYGEQFTSQTAMSLFRTIPVLSAHGIQLMYGTLGFPDITEVRNIFTTLFYDHTDCDAMLFVDVDMGFTPEAVLKLIYLNKPLAGALYPKRRFPPEFVGKALPGQQQSVDGWMKVAGLGGGILLIRREVVTQMLEKQNIVDHIAVDHHAAADMLKNFGFKRLLRPWDTIYIQENGAEKRLSEDLSFCHRWLKCGGDVWAMTDQEITHAGRHEFKGRYDDVLMDLARQGVVPGAAKLEAP